MTAFEARKLADENTKSTYDLNKEHVLHIIKSRAILGYYNVIYFDAYFVNGDFRKAFISWLEGLGYRVDYDFATGYKEVVIWW